MTTIKQLTHEIRVLMDALPVTALVDQKVMDRIEKRLDDIDAMAPDGGWIITNGKEGDECRYRTLDHDDIAWSPNEHDAVRFNTSSAACAVANLDGVHGVRVVAA